MYLKLVKDVRRNLASAGTYSTDDAGRWAASGRRGLWVFQTNEKPDKASMIKTRNTETPKTQMDWTVIKASCAVELLVLYMT